MVRAYCTTQWSSCSSPPWRHTLRTLPALLTMVLGLFVFGFFGSFVFGVIPVHCRLALPPGESLSPFKDSRSAPCVSPHISRLPSHSSEVLSGIVSLFFCQFMLELQAPFLSCSTSSSTLLFQGGSSRSTRTPDVRLGVWYCHMLMVCFRGTPLSMMNGVISWVIQTVFVLRIICPCLYSMRSRRFCAEDLGFLSEAEQFPFGFEN